MPRKKQTGPSVSRDEAKSINAALREVGFDGSGRWFTVGRAHSEAGSVLEKFGYQFSDVLSAWDVKGDKRNAGALSLGISKSDPNDPFYAMPVENTAMHFSYANLGAPPGRGGGSSERDSFEVIAYV
jgi:hypothetical protein